MVDRSMGLQFQSKIITFFVMNNWEGLSLQESTHELSESLNITQLYLSSTVPKTHLSQMFQQYLKLYMIVFDCI